MGGQLDSSSAGGDGPIGPMAGIAVGPNGDLYVLAETGEMFVFAENGDFLRNFGTPFGSFPGGIAVDSTGSIYKARLSTPAKLSPTGASLIDQVGAGVGSSAEPKGLAV